VGIFLRALQIGGLVRGGQSVASMLRGGCLLAFLAFLEMNFLGELENTAELIRLDPTLDLWRILGSRGRAKSCGEEPS